MTIKEKILTHLYKFPYRTAGETARAIKGNINSVKSYLGILTRQGFLVRLNTIGTGCGGMPPSEYRLTDVEFHHRMKGH